ncbi:hypothetical protein A2767_02300 [Candidatus Roizmanbacteria bacterium RIFCSPHIGHO2_01_FULL_35_10]|uniref:PIN domain-containing protein n=1 Tax=Candidatus Roizmanbacteria bacterium RIFCSPLOWO2_01_FULL_35_13 TaxID=1802055 RepID=A0A1F7ICZ8_9BACT|nr:MAG: hypothetical protein A2767_02300 [Candidatus Roizmanbacteria bacterium RIFCSPHIGHO2_01_FULL_35_10]OGK41223.1 MAG: hypothetical protein A3A74_04230 [Candidatus Roizmanbacteria bacterium RIFCSPLOWO2_01_FULL_35_13]
MKIKAIVDTNIFLSGALFGGIPGRILALWKKAVFIFCLSLELEGEIVDKLTHKFNSPAKFIQDVRRNLQGNFLLNLEVDELKVASYRLKEPFATLLKSKSFQLGRDRTKYLELLTTSILAHWVSIELEKLNMKFDEQNQFQGKTDLGYLYHF